MEKIVKINISQLTDSFRETYPHDLYKELMMKGTRPYCLVIGIRSDCYVCIPFRSNVQHNSAYLFKEFDAEKRPRPGLDYTKMILIRDLKYVQNGVIDKTEFKEIRRNREKIAKGASEYLDGYIEYIQTLLSGGKVHNRIQRKYQYSTLKYFHEILGLPEVEN